MDANVSSRIDLMRILPISGIVFVHIPYNPQSSSLLGAYRLVSWLRVLPTKACFRIGIPCLGAIAGYLLFRRGVTDVDYWKV
jgi:succinoglycan biosynthesis protein ExoH